jgi:putative transposase
MPPLQSHRPNYNIPGQAHELTFCCYQRYKFLKSERTCNWLADSINTARDDFKFDVWAYVFMPDHVHLVIYPRAPSYEIGTIRTAIKKPISKVALTWLRENDPLWIPRLTRKRGRRIETHSGSRAGAMIATLRAERRF